jgi:hypothetical protein
MLGDRLLALLRDAGARLDEGVTVARTRGELRVVGAGGAVHARVVPRARGGYYVEGEPRVIGAGAARRAEAALEAGLAGIVALQGWDPPFDRGPGLYPLAEIDASGVATRALAGVDVWVAHLAATCAADCVFCRHVEREADEVAERFALAAVRRGDHEVRGAYVCLGGPEPTHAPLIDEWVHALREAGAATVALIGTAEPLAERTRARTLRYAGLSTLAVPVYGASAATHDAVVRRDGAFQRLRGVLDACREEGFVVYLHTLVLGPAQDELDRIRAFAESRELPLVVGLPRPKTPDALDVDAAALAAGPVLGAPACLHRADATPGRALVDRYGPMAIYLAVQAGSFASACASCLERERCWGLPSGLIPSLAGHLRPVRSGG